MQTDRKAFNKNKKTIINRVNNLKPGEYCRLRKITPDESLRFMGISDEHIYYMLNPRLSLQERGYTDEQIDEMLVVDVLYHIFRKMFVEKGAEKGQTIPIEI